MADWPESGQRRRLAELVRRRAATERQRADRSGLAARREQRPEIAESLMGLARAQRDAADFYVRQAERLEEQANRATGSSMVPPAAAPEAEETPGARARLTAIGRRAVPQRSGPPGRPGAGARLRLVPPQG